MAENTKKQASGGAKDKGGAKGAKGAGKTKAAKTPASTGPAPVYKREQPPRLKTVYEQSVRQKLVAEFGYPNPMQVPKIVKVTLNMGLGRSVQNPKIMDAAV